MNEAEARAIFQQADTDLVEALLRLIDRRIAARAGGGPNSTDVRKLEGPLTVRGPMTFYPADDPPTVGSISEAVPTTQANTIQTVIAFAQTAPASGPVTANVRRYRQAAVITVATVTIPAGSREGRAVPAIADTRDGDWFWIEVTAADPAASHLAVAVRLGVPVARG